MPGTTTPSKYPYPLSTEPVRDGALRIKELADWIQAGPPEVQVYRNGSFTMNAGWQKVTSWSGALWSSPSAAGAGMAAHTNGITVPIGRYLCEVTAGFPVGGSGTRRSLAIGPATVGTPDVSMPQGQWANPAATNAVSVFTLTGTVQMAAAGQISLFVYTNGGSESFDATTIRFLARRIT